jgi:TPR repeat
VGIVLARQSKLPEAVARFRRAIELRPQHAKAHNNLGVAMSNLGVILGFSRCGENGRGWTRLDSQYLNNRGGIEWRDKNVSGPCRDR